MRFEQIFGQSIMRNTSSGLTELNVKFAQKVRACKLVELASRGAGAAQVLYKPKFCTADELVDNK